MIARKLALAVALACTELAASADEPLSEEPVLLTVTGSDGTAVDATVSYTIAMLRRLGAREIRTKTIWLDGVQRFEGIELSALVRALGLTDGTLRFDALNDYSAEIPVSDAVPGGPLNAWSRNGRRMTPRDKGPLWLVYPYDDETVYQTETIYARSVWHLSRIEVLPR